jgi:hypothetical protein
VALDCQFDRKGRTDTRSLVGMGGDYSLK